MITIDDKTKIKTITGAKQRLISNEKIGLICLIGGTAKSKTWTMQDAEEFTTEKAATDEIKRKGWAVPDEYNDTEVEG